MFAKSSRLLFRQKSKRLPFFNFQPIKGLAVRPGTPLVSRIGSSTLTLHLTGELCANSLKLSDTEIEALTSETVKKHFSLLLVLSVAFACGTESKSKKQPADPPPDPTLATGPSPVRTGPIADIYKEVFASVTQDLLLQDLKEMTGVVPVTVDGQSVTISDRYLPASKQRFRAYWTQFFRNLGVVVTELPYSTKHRIGELEGHNLEAVLPGKTKDSVVIIVHYDSIGPTGSESSNPGVDDDMTGMAMLLETARVLVARKAQLANTVRFVAVDYEEHTSPGLEGSRQYAAYLKQKATTEAFQIVAAVDDEQTGWNCHGDNLCSDSQGDLFDIFSCSGDSKGYSYPALGDRMEKIATELGGMRVLRGCIGQESDHYAMWEIGVPSLTFTEHDPHHNNHFDSKGGDIYAKIDTDYFFKIARIGVVFAAELSGLD